MQQRKKTLWQGKIRLRGGAQAGGFAGVGDHYGLWNAGRYLNGFLEGSTPGLEKERSRREKEDRRRTEEGLFSVNAEQSRCQFAKPLL